jgi:hypothetical protein
MVYLPIDDSRFAPTGAILDGAMTVASSSNWLAAGTADVNMLNLAGFLYAYEADSADMIAAYANTDPVGTWHETNNALDLTGGVQPTYLTAGLGGQPAVTFPQTSNARAFRASSNAWLGTNTQTIYTVCRPDAFVTAGGISNSTPQVVVANWNPTSTAVSHWQLRRQRVSTTPTMQWQYITRTSTNVQVTTVMPAEGVVSNERDTVVTARWDVGATRIRVNGTNGTDNTQSGTFRTTGVANFTIGDVTASTFDDPFRGEIACVYIYTAAHSDDTITNVEQYLADKYGITL